MTNNTKVSKVDAHYRRGTSNRSCNTCVHFDGRNSCKVVAGVINPSGVSDYYKAMKSATLNFTAETAKASTIPEPFGKPSGPGLWHVKGMMLPAYIQHVAHDLLDNGHAKSVGQAIQMAVGIVKKWAAGVPVGGETKVGGKGHKHPGRIHPDVQAAAAKAIAEWEAKRARAHAQHAAHDHSGGMHVSTVDLAPRQVDKQLGYSNRQKLSAQHAQAVAGASPASVRGLVKHTASRQAGAADLKKTLFAHLFNVHQMRTHAETASLQSMRAAHSADHAERNLSHAHPPSIAPSRSGGQKANSGQKANLSNVTQRFDAWGNKISTDSGGTHVTSVDLAMYIDPEEGGEPTSQYEVESAERRLGPDHPHTKRLRARLQKQDAARGALRDKYAEHMSQVHKRGDHKGMALEALQAEHARDHRAHPGLRHGHSPGMSPNGVPLGDSAPSEVSMSVHYDVWGKRIDLAGPNRTTPSFHIHAPKPHAPQVPKAPKPKQPKQPGATKSALVGHLRNTHGISGSHEQHSMQALKGMHNRDHAARPNLNHQHAAGLKPFVASALSNVNSLAVDLAAPKKGKDPVDSMDEAAIKKAWAKLRKLPPGLQEHMRARLLARAKKLGVNLSSATSSSASNSVNCSNPVDLAKSKKQGQYVGFEALVKRIMAQGKTEEEARAIAAQIGRAKYGASKFQKMAASGRKGG